MDVSSSSTSSNSLPPLPSTTTTSTNAASTTATMSASESSDDVPALTGASSSSSTAVGPVTAKPAGGGLSSATGICAAGSSSSVHQHVPPQQTGPISIQQWFNPHHLLTGALFGGGGTGASQIDAPSHNSSSGSGDAAVGPEQQPQHHHHWLAAGMEIVAGMMNPQSATQQQGDVTDCESTPVVVEVGDVAASSNPSSSSSSGGDSPQDDVEGPGSSNNNIVIIKALRRNRDADDDSSIPPPPPPPQHALLLSAHSMDGEFSIGTSTSDSSSAYPLKRAHHHHPLALRRSASSAFGSPCISTTSSGGVGVGGIIPMRTRTLSNGYSDPGTATTTASTSNSSAFHAWSCRSLYSNDGVGSDVSSAISSSVAYSGRNSTKSFSSSTGLSSTNSDPLPEKSSHPNRIKIGESSPWRRVMNRMKNTTVKRPSFGRTLSGRENPARPNLSDDEDRTPPLRGGSFVIVDNAGDEIVEILNPNVAQPFTSVVSVGGSKSSSSRKKKKRNKKKKKSKNKASSSPQPKGESNVDGFYDRGKAMTVATVASTKTKDHYSSYDDPGVALDLSDDSDTDDESDVFKSIVYEGEIPSQPFTNKSIMPPSQVSGRVYDLKPPPEQVDCDGIEVVSAMREASTSQNTTIMDSESSSVLGSVLIFSPIISSITLIDENSPPSVEQYTTILEDLRPGGTETDTSSLYHPIGSAGNDDDDDVPDDELDDKCGHFVSNIQFAAGNQPQVKLKYRSPQRSVTSPNRSPLLLGTAPNSGDGDHSPSSSDSRLSSLRGSPSSRISSSNSRSTTSTLNSGGDRTINTLRSIDGSLVMDSEVREANRRSIRGWRRCVGSNGSGSIGGDEIINQDVIVGNETAFSSSTTSSKYHEYFSSPRPLRDGATLPVDRFFAGGNVPMSPSPPREEFAAGAATTTTTTPSLSKFFCPKTLSRTSTRDSTHSPHTISSASVSATSSSGSETKRPLQFVAYQIREERESPFDEPPGYSHITTYATVGVGTCGTGDDTSNACPPLIKPRIYKNDSSNQLNQSRPPMIQRPSAVVIQRQLTSPRYGRSRTPTRTPPPSSYKPSSAANTPSPPVIIDGPSNVEVLGDGNMKLVQPTLSRPQQLIDASLTSDDNSVVRNTIINATRVGHLDTVEETVVTVTPDKFPFPNTARRLNLVAPKCEKTNVITPPERKS